MGQMPSQSRQMLAKMSGLLKTNRSPFIGGLIAPAVPLLVLSAVAFLSTGRNPHIFQGAVLILPASYLSSLLIGGPAVYILSMLNKHRFWHYIITGALASLVPISVILIYPIVVLNDSAPPDTGWVPAHTSIALLMGACGIIVAVTFWAVTRPDLASERSRAVR